MHIANYTSLTIILVFWLAFGSPLLNTPVKVAQAQRQTRTRPSRAPGNPNSSSNATATPSAAAGATQGKPRFASQRRVALVIGNSNYQSKDLSNPVNDAELMLATLSDLGFDVLAYGDLTRAKMEEVINTFAARLKGGGVGLFYYAGHGVQIGGRNYLVPVNYGTIASTKDVEKELLYVGTVLEAMSATSGLNIIILDACRNAPKDLAVTGSINEGFAEIKNPSAGTYIAFATAPGQVAEDGTDQNSPYTKALARNLRMRPSRLEDVFIRTRIETEKVTGGQQVPWENGALKTWFYFTDEAQAPAGASQVYQSPLKQQLLKGLFGGLLSSEFPVPQLNERGSPGASVVGRANYFSESAGGLSLEMAEIPAGSFQMGSSAEDAAQAFEEFKKYNDEITKETVSAEMPQHLVQVPGFFMSKYEITQAQWQTVMGGLPQIEPQFRGAKLPVVNVTWNEAMEFCARLSQLTGRDYRLPTEAEWEYACRAGTTTPFAFGQTTTPQLTVYNSLFPFGGAPKGAARNFAAPVGQGGRANAFGLYDMHGNVAEWCADYWHESYNGAPTDGSARDEVGNEPLRVVRGGSWYSAAQNCRSASRGIEPSSSTKTGFRVVAN